ncbi:PepSY domain-containing protein [Schlesneria sp. DSM 10557]|uniref:PepSY domain-containing protein n=1 Tax=Schlesneria sp. DSM 10557 TaxID=3044399 RepID=UPI00359F92D2
MLHLIRRGHLYAGLLLIPWVILFGVTGFLFNHSTFWPEQPVIHVRQSHTRGTSVASLPKAVDIAEEVVSGINAKVGSRYKLVNPGSVNFTRGAFGAVLNGAGGDRYTVQLFPNGTGVIRVAPAGAANAQEAEGERTTQRRRETPVEKVGGSESSRGPDDEKDGKNQTVPAGETGPVSQPQLPERNRRPEAEKGAPFATSQGMLLKTSVHEAMESGLPEVLRRLKLDHTKASNIRASTVKFKMSDDEKTWDVTYDPNSGAVSGIDTSESPGISFRMFLLRLHMTHGYLPGDGSVRWLWVIMADATALIMIFWAVSGLVMWWQIKRTRLPGSICLGISLLVAIYIGLGMHEMIASAIKP